jgi:protein-tyrosine phosphatase
MFVDIHNHILPGIDDGAPDLAYALEMARLAVAGGTDVLVATPHRAWGARREASPTWVKERIAPGVEIPVGPHVAEDLKSGVLGTLGDAGAYALVEPPFDRIPHDAIPNLHAILETGINVVLAHPERNAEVQKHLAFVEACASLGLSFQVTTGSILGRFGPKAQKTAEDILDHWREWSIVIASDSHDRYDRPPSWMAMVHDLVAARTSPEEADAMFNARPRAMVTGAPLP